MTDRARTATIGGRRGLLARRFYHTSAGTLFPLFFYLYGHRVANYFDITTDKLYFTIFVGQAFLESLRLYYGCIFFGLRYFERSQLSSQFWGATGILSVIAFAPWKNRGITLEDRAYIGLPICYGLAWFDPFVGELKVRGYQRNLRIILSLIFIYILWFLCGSQLQTPPLVMYIIPPIVVAAEYPNCGMIDDNILLCIIPLICVHLLQFWELF